MASDRRATDRGALTTFIRCDIAETRFPAAIAAPHSSPSRRGHDHWWLLRLSQREQILFAGMAISENLIK